MDEGGAKAKALFMGLRRSLSGVPAGTRAGESCRAANFSFASFESANFAASASIFRGCLAKEVDDDTGPVPFPPIPPVVFPEVKLDCAPEAVLLLLLPSPEDELEREVVEFIVMELCRANVVEDPRIGDEEETESDWSLKARSCPCPCPCPCPAEGTLFDDATHAPVDELEDWYAEDEEDDVCCSLGLSPPVNPPAGRRGVIPLLVVEV